MTELLQPKKVRNAKGHIRNLITLAKADGNLDSSEVNYILKIAEKNGIKLTQVQQWLNNKNTGAISINADLNLDRKFDHIYDMVQIMCADGKVSEEEMDICVKAAKQMGFKKTIVALLVRKVCMGVNEGLDRETLKIKASDFLNY